MDPTLWLHFLFLFCQDPWLTGSLFPNQGWNLCPLQQKHGVLTTRPPGKSLHVVKPYINGVKMYIIETSLVVQWVRYWAPNVGDLGSISGQGTRSHMLQRRPGEVKWIKRKMYIIMQINKLRIPLILWPFQYTFFSPSHNWTSVKRILIWLVSTCQLSFSLPYCSLASASAEPHSIYKDRVVQSSATRQFALWILNNFI